jgi:hypothetical protein
MSKEDADILQEILERSDSWPVWSADGVGGMTTSTFAQAGNYGESLRDIATWVALRESDKKALKRMLNWDTDRQYRIDPLPERIGEAFSDLLFSEDPVFTAPKADDQKKLDEMVSENYLPEQLRRWCDQAVTEGEIWWRVYVDRDQSEWPILEAHSRLDVIPLFYGRKIKAIAFVSDILSQQVKLENSVEMQVWRHLEIQSVGYVRNLLFKGSVNELGKLEPLGSDPYHETEGIPEEWDHGIDTMFAGRVVNRLGRDWRLGISQLKGVKDLIFDLNESRTIMAENARNTAKAKMIVSADQLDENGQYDPGKDVIIAESVNEALDDKKETHVVLEYTFQAKELMVHIDELVQTILARCGLAEQFVQTTKGGGGQAYTGTALRTRLIPTTLASSGKGKFWDRAVPEMLGAMAQAANLPIEAGGCGQSFAEADGKFKQKRGNILPEDENEATQRVVMGVQGEVTSIHTGVRELHPEWTDDEVDEEVERIEEDHAVPLPVHDPNEPPGANKGVADAQPRPGTQTADLRDAVGTRQPGTKSGTKGQSPGKQPPVVTAGGN